jgi:hypothetical protein
MPAELDQPRLKDLIQSFADRLDGEWVLLGGALAATWISPRRVTEDIDLVGLSGTTAERLQLMQAAIEIGLPVEAVTSASIHYLEAIPNWREELEVFVKGARATIHRPNPTLFLHLKARRLSEQDLADCLALIEKAQAEDLALDQSRVRSLLDALPPTEDEDLRQRRLALGSALG